MAWVLLTAVCTEAWSICPGSVPESEPRVTSTRSHRELDKLPTLFGSQGPLHSPGSKNQTPCPLDVRIGLATKALTFTFHYELHEGSVTREISTNLGVVGPKFQKSSIF